MRVQHFLEHHGIASNPFADEDAQTDLVFKGACIRTTYHPSWDKIYGDPTEPATAIVFGEKGAGKTALGLQVVRHLFDYNGLHLDRQTLVIPYSDFNPFLDHFRGRLSSRRRRMDRALAQWRLWDHMDAILSLGVTQLVDRVLGNRQTQHPAAIDAPLPVAKLDRSQVRDVLLLAACYDQSTAETPERRWRRLRRKLRFAPWAARLTRLFGLAVAASVIGLIVHRREWTWLQSGWPYAIVAAAWLPWAWRWLRATWTALRIHRRTRAVQRGVGLLRRLLTQFSAKQLAAQPLPIHAGTDDRYALLAKLQSALRTLGMPSVVVLVDRLDEPYLINGSPELMRALLWPMLDNKFLKHPGMGIKLLLPAELLRFVDQETRDFYEKARLDKQNMIRSLEWTGQALYDVADARIKACAAEGASPALLKLFDEAVDARRLQDALAALRSPRRLFKFLYRLLTAHCNAHTEQEPSWRISAPVFESTLAVYLRDQDAADRGMGAI